MPEINLRKPVAAGQFYPSSADSLRKQIEGFIDKKTQKQDVIACMLPHAGYIYSGKVASQTVARINIRNKVILIGPNHTGYGVEFSIMTEGIWQTPLGDIEVDSGLAKSILAHCSYLKEDSLAHAYEHSLEVELPILQASKDDFRIVPIVISSDEINVLKAIGEDIAKAIKESGLKDSVMLVASSDMTHYEPQEQAQEKDREALEAILRLDEDKLSQKVKRLSISMYEYAPVAIMLVAAKALG